MCGLLDSPEHKVEGRLLLDVVVAEGTAVLKLLASEDQALLVRGDTKGKRSDSPTLPLYPRLQAE